jgi:hypothetical protein
VKRTRIKRVSTKQAAINRKYALLRLAYLGSYPACEFEGCGMILDGNTVHHIKGRGKHTLDVTTFMTVCPADHYWIHFVNPKKARAMGYLK